MSAVGTVETRGLSKRYGDVEALRSLDLSVPAGSVFGFLGPNGSGKTTTLSILAGLSRPTGGQAWVSGLDVVHDGMAVRERIGFLRQDPQFYSWMTGLQTLSFVGEFFGLTGKEANMRSSELLELVDLTGSANRRVGGYSGGMRQRLGVAQALVGSPQVLLLDEPCSSLDPAGRYEVVRIMERLRGSTTVFYSTHILQDVERVADEVAIVSRGERIRQAPMKDLLAASKDELIVEVEGPVDALVDDVRRQPYIAAIDVAAEPSSEGLRRITLNVTDLSVARRAIPRLVVNHEETTFVSCRPHRPDLESVFLELTGGESGDRK
jgi:ABC-2 type transport system ATP-binding protein